jgi:serine/threonine protein kinase
MTDVIHGDIKPDNVLIFKNEHGNFISKLADFGFSTLSMQENELILLPRSNPWVLQNGITVDLDFRQQRK